MYIIILLVCVNTSVQGKNKSKCTRNSISMQKTKQLKSMSKLTNSRSAGINQTTI